MAYTSPTFTSPRPSPEETAPEFSRADLQFLDVNHGSQSFEGRIYVNRPDADLRTPKRVEAGYAGSLYVFGHPHCWGDAGHCDVPPGPLHGYDDRPPHHLVPQLHVVEITAALQVLLAQDVPEFTVTVLPITRKGRRRRINHELLRFQGLRFVTYE